jgi:hypothetical protein
MRSQASVLVLPIACALFIVAVYFPDVGRGFIKDDFTWIRTAQTATAHPVTLIRQPDAGFYRPGVTLAFAFDYAAHGWKPRGYGWTNVALYVWCAGALVALALALGLPWRAALLAAVLWAVNPHGVNMAILWLSGRTATLLTLFSLLAAVAFLRRWYAAAAMLIALALLSKEEAVMLPFILLTWAWIQGKGTRPPWTAFAAAFAPLAIYLGLRALTPAMTPATAPPFYRFTADPLLVLRNVGEYLDRSATLAVAALVCATIVYRARPRVTGADRPALAMLAVWWAGMFAITIWLPVRSSLYAVCPSVAAAMASALLIDRMRETSAGRFLQCEPVLAILLVAAIPIYQMRDGLRAEAARVSQRTLAAIERDLPSLPRTGVVVLHEDPDAAVFHEAFGDLPAEALRTRFGRDWDARIVAAAAPSRGTAAGGDVIAEYWIRHGTLTRTAGH